MFVEPRDAGTEVRLPGGNVGGAVRVGETVRRVAGQWSPNVHALLAHLRDAGLDAIPTVLGFDKAGREVLAYVDGETAESYDPWPAWVWSDALLVQAAQWMRRYHNAVRNFVPATSDWRLLRRPLTAGELICHYDIGPYNMVVDFDVDDEPVLKCVLDWDATGPGLPLDDLGSMAWRLLPCWDPAGHADAEIVRRLQLMADSYGTDAHELLERITPVIAMQSQIVRTGAAAGDAGMQNLIAGGYVDLNEAQLREFQGRLPNLRRLLG